MTAFVTRCIRCRQQRCLCGEIVRVKTALEFVIVRHRAEKSRVSNTAHYAQLALGCTIFDYGVRDQALDESQLGGENTFLLFPEGPPPPEKPPARVIVLDGSWAQARRMRQRIVGLRGLPMMSLPPPDHNRLRLRRPVRDYGMSTIEAIAQVIARYEGEAQAESLERLHDIIVQNGLSRRRGPIPPRHS